MRCPLIGALSNLRATPYLLLPAKPSVVLDDFALCLMSPLLCIKHMAALSESSAVRLYTNSE